MVIHWFEQIIQRRLSTRFGWNSVLWTGWLGTPIHESSHLLMCPVFRHRIDEVAFFEPDRKSGRLGYVRHSFHQGNWFEEMGNLFIGIAPLMGGSLVLLILNISDGICFTNRQRSLLRTKLGTCWCTRFVGTFRMTIAVESMKRVRKSAVTTRPTTVNTTTGSLTTSILKRPSRSKSTPMLDFLRPKPSVRLDRVSQFSIE